MAKPVKLVVKPILYGTWNGGYATRKGLKMILSILFIGILYTILGLMLSFDSAFLRVLTSSVLIFFACFYMYSQGINAGEGDAHFSEIMYQHQQEGKTIAPQDLDRCYHPGKGFYEVMVALIPYLLITLVFAFLVRPLTYTLGVLPSWLNSSMEQTHVGEALSYYTSSSTSLFMPILRVIVRALTMPFINVALLLDTNGMLWAERLTPLWISFAPLAYGIGYLQGPSVRTKVNTGIKIGVHNKKRKERKARKVRTASKTPERLI